MENDNIFCAEPIIGVYLGQPEDELTYGGELFLDCYQEDITLYLTKGFRYLLETEHYGISVEYNGIFLLHKTDDVAALENDGEWLDSYYHDDFPDEDPWINHEYTLFVGEHLVCVKKLDDGYFLAFDDFSIKVVPIEEDDTDNLREKLWDHESHRMYGFERYLNQKCTCGGQGIAYADHVHDFCIECENCHKHIPCDQMNIQDAIDEWNYINTHTVE